MDKADFKIEFRCHNCGRKFSVPESRAGKKGKCPKCKNIVVVPEIQAVSPLTEQSDSGVPEVSSKNSADNVIFLEAIEKDRTQDLPLTQSGDSEKAAEHNQELDEEPAGKNEILSQRRLPWFVDILLYPISASGMVHLAILSFLPRMLLPLGHLNWLHPPIFGLGFLVIFIGYLLYCLSDCIRDSANGGRRAPNIDISPTVLLNIGELISPILKVFVCIAVCLGPLLAYLIITKRTDIIFWLLVTYGILFLPMALLAEVLFDSLRALNPILIITSMLNVFLPYCGLVLLFFAVCGLISIIIVIMPQSWIISYILSVVCIYLTIVMAHLLGRFCYKYGEKLNWEV